MQDLSRRVDAQFAAWDTTRSKDVAEFNAMARRENVPSIVIPALSAGAPKKESGKSNRTPALRNLQCNEERHRWHRRTYRSR